MKADLLVLGGMVVDGTGKPPIRADVVVAGDRIEEIGMLDGVPSATEGVSPEAVIDAAGLTVAPGLIDIHSHSDYTLLVDPRAASQVYQGVTTEVVGNCGHGCAPVAGEPSRFASNAYGYRADHPLQPATFAEYLEALDSSSAAVNVAALVPHGNLRLACVSDLDRAATGDELATMRQLLHDGLEAGAWGYSTGLEYPAERASSREELVELCTLVAEAGGLYAAHTRNRELKAVAGVEEAVLTAQESGVRLQISHVIPRRGGPPHNQERCLSEVDRARENGVDVGIDVHTRLHGITNLLNAVPPRLAALGRVEFAAAMRDDRVVDQVRRYGSIIVSFGRGGWDRVSLLNSDRQPELRGVTVARLAGGMDPFESICEVLAVEAEEGGDPSRVMCVCYSYEEADILGTAARSDCTVGSDATALCPDGPLAANTFLGAYTWAAWFFRRAVTETRSLTIQAAVRKLTSAPAARLGLSDRGELRPGLAADIAVFDPARFRDRGSLDNPNVLAEGMVHVVVNGQPVLRYGSPTGARPGRVLRRA